MAVDLFVDFGPAAKGAAQVTVVGESQDKTYPKLVQIQAFDLAVSNPTTIGSQTGGAGAGKAQFKPIKFTHAIDSASPSLFQALTTGSHFPTVKLYVRKAGGGTGAAYLIYNFALVFVTDMETAISSGDEGPVETVQMVYGALQVSYQTQSPTGQLNGQPLLGTWNQVTNSASLTVPGN